MNLSKEETTQLLNELDKLIFRPMKVELEKRLPQEKIIAPEIKIPILDPRFASLPKEVQDAIAKSNWKEKLYEIAPKYKLNIEQMGIFEDITIKVMLNTIHPDRYEEELASKIIIPKEDISNLVKDVNENILKKIRGLMEIKEEIPIPPYVKTIKNYELGIKNGGENIIKNEELGIKNEEKTPNTTEKSITDKPITQPVNQPVDDKPKDIMNIVEEKLKSATMSEHTISDHSPKTPDPYREAF
jgi:hypothetical protein